MNPVTSMVPQPVSFYGTTNQDAVTQLRKEATDAFGRNPVRFSGSMTAADNAHRAFLLKELNELPVPLLVDCLGDPEITKLVRQFGLWRSVLQDKTWANVDFSDVDLRGADFGGLSLIQIDFSRARIDETTNFKGATLRWANLGEHVLDQGQYDETTDFENTLLAPNSKFCPEGYRMEDIELNDPSGGAPHPAKCLKRISA